MGFLDSYKRLEKLCNEIYGGNRGVSAYIEDMKNLTFAQRYVVDWNNDLEQLKHYRWVRNQIAHDPNCTEENMCKHDDAQWIDIFHNRLMTQTDPLAMYRKATKPQPAAKPKQQYPSPQYPSPQYPSPQSQTAYSVQPVYKKKKVKKASGWIVLLIIAAFIALLFLLNYLGH